MAKVSGVGIIGASAERGWAKDSHVPAVQGLAGLELVAVAGSTLKGAQAAAEAFNAKAAYGSGLELVRDPAVEIVTVAVKVPDHRELVLAALAAGKHVYCEWPLGRSAAETEELAETARRAGMHTAIGLQMRSSAALRQAQEVLADGRIGRPLRARMLSRTVAFGPKVEEAMRFAEDPANGVTLLSIQGGHTIDLAQAVLGEMESYSALLTTQFRKTEWAGLATPGRRTIADHLLLQARLAGGVACGLEVAGGCAPDQTASYFEVTGERGVMVIEGDAPRGMQSGRLRLIVNGVEERLDEGELAGMPDAAVNVAGMYRLLRDDIANGSWLTPGFADALRLARLLDGMTDSSERGVRVGR